MSLKNKIKEFFWNERINRIFLFILIGVIAFWAINWLTLYSDKGRGTFGDMFGAVNALFSGLAFAGVIYAILLQRKELELQRRELEMTRGELEGQKLQLQAQNETFKLQSFENTFFQLLRLHNDIVDSMSIIVGFDRETSKGCEYLKVLYGRLKNKHSKYVRESQHDGSLIEVNDIYLNLYKDFEHILGHYFRNLYNIVKFVKNSDIEQKRLYTNFVRAQLSSVELALLFYNCLSDQGRLKFKPLVEEFRLLQNLPKDIVLDDRHMSLYEETAFRK